MNIGELKLQNVLSNSQLQLNNDLLISKKEEKSSFDYILKKKVFNRSVDAGGDYQNYRGLKNVTVKKNAVDRFESKIALDYGNSKTVRANGLRKQINGEIAQNKFLNKSERADSRKFTKNVSINNRAANTMESIKEKLQALEESIKEELGISIPMEPSEEVLADIATVLGIEVSVVEELLQENEELDLSGTNFSALVEIIESNPEIIDLISEKLVSLSSEDGLELLNKFSGLFTQVVEQLPELQLEIKEKLNSLIEKIDLQTNVTTAGAQLASGTKSEQTPVENIQVSKTDNEKTDVLTANTASDNQKVKTESKVEVMEVKTQPQNNSDERAALSKNSKHEPLVLAESKVATEGKIGVNDQISVMKDQNTLISSAKVEEQPRAMLARSITNQIVQGTKMSVNLSDTGSEILIKLNPKNLGNVALKMSFEKGVLLAQITVQNNTVKGLIETNLIELKNSLKNEGYMIGELDVSVNKDNSEHQREESRRSFNRKVDNETFEDIELKILTENQRIVTDKEVDYLA